MLTHKQFQLLRLIDDRVRDSGVPPSYDEMVEAMKLRSKSGIFRMLNALEERGFIRRLPHRARAIEVLKLPEPPRSRHVFTSGPDGVAILITGRIHAGALFRLLETHYGAIDVVPDNFGSDALCTVKILGPSGPARQRATLR